MLLWTGQKYLSPWKTTDQPREWFFGEITGPKGTDGWYKKRRMAGESFPHEFDLEFKASHSIDLHDKQLNKINKKGCTFGVTIADEDSRAGSIVFLAPRDAKA